MNSYYFFDKIFCVQDKGNTSAEPPAKKRRKDEDQEGSTSHDSKEGMHR